LFALAHSIYSMFGQRRATFSLEADHLRPFSKLQIELLTDSLALFVQSMSSVKRMIRSYTSFVILALATFVVAYSHPVKP
jgi:hypothetical protein